MSSNIDGRSANRTTLRDRLAHAVEYLACSAECRWQSYFSFIGGMYTIMMLNCLYIAFLATYHFILASVTLVLLANISVAPMLCIKLSKLSKARPVAARVVKTKEGLKMSGAMPRSYVWVRPLEEDAAPREESLVVGGGESNLDDSSASADDFSSPPGSHFVMVSPSDGFVVGDQLQVHPLFREGLATSVIGYCHLPHEKLFLRHSLLNLLKFGGSVGVVVPLFQYLLGLPYPFASASTIQNAARDSFLCDEHDQDYCTIPWFIYLFYVLFVGSSILPSIWIGALVYKKMKDKQQGSYTPLAPVDPDEEGGGNVESGVELEVKHEGVVA